ncbi:hypothetical protein RI129_002656 [Pyrocoelia pectoralis]|uniref:Uncharacterized protein n=1 Tax=Pyrocoelia pectoralis TaxID=417401 RepID=A0AAN7VQ17_9COLE
MEKLILDSCTIQETGPSSFILNMDLVSYLVLTISFYTKEQIKAYKNLNSFNIFKPCCVTKCSVLRIKNFSVIFARVKHLQRLNDAPLQVYVISN